MLENGLDKCNCTKIDCVRHGKCKECIENHKTMKLPPYCMREREEDKANKGR